MGEGFGIGEISIPDEICGWVLVGRGPRPDQVAGAITSLHRANIASLAIDLPPGTHAATQRICCAAGRIRRELAGGGPVSYLGTGAGAGAGWAASLAGGLDGVIAFNGTPGTAWRALRHVHVPSLLVVDGELPELPWRLLLARTMSWRLGRADIEIARGWPPLEPARLAQWYSDRILSPPPIPRPRPRRAHTRIATVGLAAGALALPTLTATALPDFAVASRLPAREIAGDNLSGRHAAKQHEKTEGMRLTANQIGGDNAAAKPDPTGGIALIDDSGVQYFINNGITFSTSSSASGAMSEANYTHAVAASTLNGGTAQSTLNDSYDGYEALCVANDNAVNAPCATGNTNYTIYNKNGPPSTESNGRQVDFNAQTINGLTMTRKVFVPSNDSFGRWLDIVHNPGSSAATVTLETSNNLGSDANTRIVSDSSGNTAPGTSDTWVTTFQNFFGPATTTTDPRLGHVLGSLGATVGLAGIFFQNGNDRPYWGYTVSVPAGATRIIMNYGVVQPSRAAAATKSAQLASLGDSHQLDFMTPSEQAEVVNFAIPPSATADSYSTPHDTTLNQSAPGVLGNDPGAADLTAVLVSGPAHGSSFTLNPDGSFSYTPTAGFAGTDSFTYEAKGAGGGVSAPTTVTLTVVGHAPAITSAATAPFTVGQHGSFKITTAGVPAAAITESGGLPSGLRFTANGDGTATISGTPAPGTHGSDELTVTATNNQGQPATQQLTLQISRGAAPTAGPHNYATRSGQFLTVQAPGLLKNANGESSLRAVLASGPTEGGKISLNPDGAFTYRAKPGFVGTDSFTYEAVDIDGGTSAPATVTITVTRPSRIRQDIKDIRRATEEILASYRSIAASTKRILAGVTSQGAISRANKILSQAAARARKAHTEVHKVSGENASLAALTTIADARVNAASARKLAAKARVIAAKARAAGT